MTDSNKTTLIIPCYNEETNIEKGVLDRIGDYTKDNPEFQKVIIVDDGSNDKSKKFIKERYLPLFPKFALIENNHQGKAYAIITGIKNSSTKYVMFSDIDLATPPEESDKLIKYAKEGYQIVIGSRPKREGAPLMRRVMAKGFIFVRNTIIGLNGIKDTQCGFKLFDRDSALTIIDKLEVFKKNREIKGSSVSAGFDLEFLYLAKKMGCKIKEVTVTWRHMETKNVNFFRDSYETIKDIFRMKYYELRGIYDFKR